MPSESKLEMPPAEAEASDGGVAFGAEAPERDPFESNRDSTAKYARDAAAALVAGSGASADFSPSPPRPGFVPVREQKTIISKRPAASPSSATPVGAPLVREIGASLVGQMLDHFELVEFVGGGGMGAVFRAIDTHLGRDVAVKVLSRDQNDEETIRRFKNEAQSTARLDHPNIARVYYVGEALGWNYIVFEFIEGANIRDLIHQRGAPLPLEEAISYVLQIAQALEHASQRDVVHRDIKPSNILITPQRVAKLVDMGLARLHQVESPDNDLTASGVTLGTFDYISPEQARDPRSADVRSDLYSLGCTFYYMLTGRPPFVDGTVLQKLLSHTSDEPPDVRLYRPDLSEDVTDILAKLLAKNPRDRFQQPADLIAQLAVLAEHYGWTEYGWAEVARTGAVWVAAPETAFTRVERWLPVLMPCLLLIAVAVFLAAPWSQSPQDSFEPPKPNLIAGDEQLPAAASANDSTSKTTVNREGSSIGGGAAVQEAPNSKGKPATSGEAVTPAASGASAKSNGQNEPSKAEAAATPALAAGIAGAGAGGVTAFGPGENASPPSIVGAPAIERADGADEPGNPIASLENSNRESKTASGEVALNSSRGDPKRPADLTVSGGNSSPPTATQAPRKSAPDALTKRLVVGAPEASPGADAFVVGSLAAASRYAADYPHIEAIELWYDGPKLETPLSFGGKRMTVRAGKGFRPQIVLRPAVGSATDGGLIRLAGGDFTFSGIDWWCELPAGGYGSWSLFQLDRAVGIDLTDCTVTLVNADETGRDFSSAVAVVEIRPAPVLDPVASEMSGTMPESPAPSTTPSTTPSSASSTAPSTTASGMGIPSMPTTASPSTMMPTAPPQPNGEMPTGGMATSGMAEEGVVYGPTAIRLNRSLVRGEANLIFAERAGPFSLQWNQGLLISNRRLLEIGAVSKEPDWGAPIEVELSQVTVFAASGLCLYRSSGDGGFALPLNVDSRYCIFLADPTSPFIEHRLPKKEGFEPTLYVAGVDNFYPPPILNQPYIYWRTGEGAAVVDRAIDRRDSKWCVEVNAQRGALWAAPPSPEEPIHTRNKRDYLLGIHATNSATRTGGVGGLAGFTPDRLPSAPKAPELKSP